MLKKLRTEWLAWAWKAWIWRGSTQAPPSLPLSRPPRWPAHRPPVDTRRQSSPREALPGKWIEWELWRWYAEACRENGPPLGFITLPSSKNKQRKETRGRGQSGKEEKKEERKGELAKIYLLIIPVWRLSCAFWLFTIFPHNNPVW